MSVLGYLKYGTVAVGGPQWIMDCFKVWWLIILGYLALEVHPRTNLMVPDSGRGAKATQQGLVGTICGYWALSGLIGKTWLPFLLGSSGS